MFAGIDATVDGEGVRPLSFTAHLLRAPTTQPYEIHVDVLRAGRTVWTLSARIVQDDRLIATALSSYAAERPGPDFDERPMPEVRPPSMARDTQGYRPEFAFPFADNIVVQERLGPSVFSAPDGPMDRVGWIGFVTPRPIDGAALLRLCDTGMMAWWLRLERMHLTATLDHTTHFRTDLDTVDADGFVLIRSRTGLVRGGYLDWDADVWAPDGALLWPVPPDARRAGLSRSAVSRSGDDPYRSRRLSSLVVAFQLRMVICRVAGGIPAKRLDDPPAGRLGCTRRTAAKQPKSQYPGCMPQGH